MCFLKEIIEEVILYYILGMTEFEISELARVSHNEVVKILNTYTRYLDM